MASSGLRALRLLSAPSLQRVAIFLASVQRPGLHRVIHQCLGLRPCRMRIPHQGRARMEPAPLDPTCHHGHLQPHGDAREGPAATQGPPAPSQSQVILQPRQWSKGLGIHLGLAQVVFLRPIFIPVI